MIQVCISSSLLILVVVLLRRLLRKKISLRLQYALWLLVAIRLLIPIELGESAFSVNNLTRQPQSVVQSMVQRPITAPQTTVTAPNTQTNAPVTPPAQNISHSMTATTNTPQATVNAGKTPLTVREILYAVWLIGIAGMAVWFGLVNLRFNRRASRNAQPLQVEGFPLKVYVTKDIPSPCLLGLFRPKVYLIPMDDPTAQKHVLTHEWTHYRHGDALWAVVRALCLCVYWFNPLVWWAAILSRQDCELACDEGAIRRLGEDQRIPYGKTLVSMITYAGRPNNLLQTATTMTETKKQLKERVEMITKKPKKLILALICLVLALSITVGCTFTGAKSETEPKNEPEATETPTEDVQPSGESTETPTVPAGTEPTPTEAAPDVALKGVSLYCDALQHIIDISYPGYGTGEGMLYDVDGNGTDELIMVYSCAKGDAYAPYMVCDVYTMAENRAVTLLDQHELYLEVGGPSGSAGVASIDGKDYLYVTRELYDIGQDVNHYQNGKWELFSLEGAEITLVTEVDYSFVSRLDSNGELKNVPEESTAAINGEPMTIEDYQLWYDNMWLTSVDGYHEDLPTESAWSTEDLLAHCNQNLFLLEAQKLGISPEEQWDMQMQWNGYIGIGDSAAWLTRECIAEGTITTIYSAILHEYPMNAYMVDTLAEAVSAQYKYWEEHGDFDYMGGGMDDTTPPCYQVKSIAINASNTYAKVQILINGVDFGVYELDHNVFLLPVESEPITANVPASVELRLINGALPDATHIFVYLDSNISGAR